MAIGADQSIGIGNHIAILVRVGPNGLGKIFKVHLMANARSGGNNAEIVERVLTPFEEGIALHIALIFAVHIHLEGAWIAEFVNHDRVVNHQINRVERVNLLGIATKRHQRIAHRGQIDHGGNACEILKQNARRAIGDLARVIAALLCPFRERLDVIDRNGLAIFEAKHVLKNNFQRGGQAREIAKTCGFGSSDGVIGVRFIANFERFARVGRIMADGDGHVCLPQSSGNGLVLHMPLPS